jgi:hypothetical protein
VYAPGVALEISVPALVTCKVIFLARGEIPPPLTLMFQPQEVSLESHDYNLLEVRDVSPPHAGLALTTTGVTLDL